MNRFKHLIFSIGMLLTIASGYSQGVTNSAISGRVSDNLGEPLPGANVIATHLPTGTNYGVSSDFDGFFRLSNLRSGGPYKITISFIGFKTYEEDNIVLGLGETKRINISLQEEANTLDEVIVTADNTGIFNSNKNGSSTAISQRDIQKTPSVSRGIADFVRLTPQAQITGDNVISIAGQNNRYNAIYIDGAVNNDVYGLAGTGTNGGQTGVNPFSVDAIESFQVNVAPFDVKISGFSGGAISAVTKSGSNNLEGSVYSFFRNQDLAGKTPYAISKDNRKKLDDFSALTYGVRLGGPIIKDKLFFFVNYERQDDEKPQPFDISNYLGASDANRLQELSDYLKTKYNYNPGDYRNNTSSLKSHKLIAKFDWNVNNNNKISLKHSFVKATKLDVRSSDRRNINFFNTAQYFPSITNSTSFQWDSNIGNKYANNLIIGYTSVQDDRNPYGQDFPYVGIIDNPSGGGKANIYFGSERFSTANKLDQSTLTFTDNFNIYLGKHKITLGTHNEFSSAYNVFVPNNYGYYQYHSLQDFLDDKKPRNFEHRYSLISNKTGDNSDGFQTFKVFQLGAYVQDEIDITNDFRISAGVRVDTPIWFDGKTNEHFNDKTIKLLEAEGKDLKGAKVGLGIKTRPIFSPRAGFNWNVGGKSQTQIRGGLGVFTSRMPLAWPGGTYGNNGMIVGEIRGTSKTPNFNPDPYTQAVRAQPGTNAVEGDVDLFAPDFKLPQVLKYNLAIDQKLPLGFVLSVDAMYNDNLSAIYYQNLNLKNSTKNLTGTGDNRPKWDYTARIDKTYNGIYLASNTNKGYSWNTSVTLRKTQVAGFSGSLTYSYGDAMSVFEGSSSINSSQWRYMVSQDGKNSDLKLARSQYAQGHRVMGIFGYEFNWSENVKTTLSFIYEGQQGSPYSYTYNTSRREYYILNDDYSSDAALMYVPKDKNDIHFKTGGKFLSTDQQWEILNNYIEGDEYLKSRRGKYAERNAQFGPWSHIIDAKLIQDVSFSIKGKKHSLQATLDIFNLTNLLNKKWGVREYVSNHNQASILDAQGFIPGTTTPLFSINEKSTDIYSVDDSGLQSSRWQIQVGLRYSFK